MKPGTLVVPGFFRKLKLKLKLKLELELELQLKLKLKLFKPNNNVIQRHNSLRSIRPTLLGHSFTSPLPVPSFSSRTSESTVRPVRENPQALRSV